MTWRWRLRSLIPPKSVESDLDDELNAHLEMRAVELQQAGMSAADARLEARRRFGSPAAVREKTRDSNVARAVETFWQDVRYGCHMLRRQPGFAIAAILTLAVAIGASGAIFSVVDAILLRPLPYSHPEQLVFAWGKDAVHNRWSISPADLDDWRQTAKSFTALSSLQGQSVNLTGIEQPTRVTGFFVSSDFFPMLDVPIALGRGFRPGEDQPGGERIAVISYALWQTRFGGDSALLGRKLILNGEPFTVVGIMAREFNPPLLQADVFVPPYVYPGYTRDRAQTVVIAMGRLKPGVSVRQGQAELDTICRQLARAYPDTNHDRGALLVPLRDILVDGVRPTVLALTAAVGCLLLIACANIANLLLSKAAGRRQEMSVRAALGASRFRLVRQLLTESLVLAFAGAACGVAIAYAMARFVAAKLSDWPSGVDVSMNVEVLAFMAAVSVVTAVIFGLAPALMARRAAATGLRVFGDRGRTRLRSMLAIGQVALALVMLIGSGLMIESLRGLLHVDPGFDGSQVLTMEYRLPLNKYPKGSQQEHFHDEVVARVQALPGVESAGIVRGLPFSGNGGAVAIGLPDRPAPAPSSPFTALYNAATPTYFATVRIPLRAGRAFVPADDSNAHRVVVVSDSFVRRYWPGRSAADVIGRQVLIPERDLAPGKVEMVAASIAGVVGATRHDKLEEPEFPEIWVPYAQDPMIFASLAVRTRGNPMDHVRDVQRAVWSIDKDQPMWKIRTLSSLVDATLGQRRVLLTLLASFSGVALLLAGLGLYGVMSYQVTQRTAELGIRVALGAGPGSILGMVLRQGLTLAGAGLAAGIALAPILARLLQNQLFGVGSVDAGVYGVFATLLLAVSAGAVLLPAWRATRLDPIRALRID